jgi:hypothetical protein
MTDTISRRSVLQGIAAFTALGLGSSLFGSTLFAQSAPVISSVFDQRETQIIRDYYRMQVEKARANRGKGGGVPPGLPRKDELPPGIARAIRVNAPLPPNMPKKGLPADLERSLPIRVGVVRIIAGDQVMLVDAKNTVRDIVQITDILDRLYSR